eukprot:13333873-Ditylum_brightwellii.AAC.1
MLKCVNNFQKSHDMKESVESNAKQSKINNSSDKEDDGNEEDLLPITQEDNKESATVTNKLSEDKVSIQDAIEDKQKNSMKTTMMRVMKTRKQKLLQHCCSPCSNEKLKPGENATKHE